MVKATHYKPGDYAAYCRYHVYINKLIIILGIMFPYLKIGWVDKDTRDKLVNKYVESREKNGTPKYN